MKTARPSSPVEEDPQRACDCPVCWFPKGIWPGRIGILWGNLKYTLKRADNAPPIKNIRVRRYVEYLVADALERPVASQGHPIKLILDSPKTHPRCFPPFYRLYVWSIKERCYIILQMGIADVTVTVRWIILNRVEFSRNTWKKIQER